MLKMIYYSGYSVSQSEAIVSLLSESLHKSLEPLWASVITHREIVSIEIWEIRRSDEFLTMNFMIVLLLWPFSPPGNKLCSFSALLWNFSTDYCIVSL